MLKNFSRIKISGGCEVFAEGSISFVPLDHDKAMVQVENSGNYFYDEHSEPIPSFEVKVLTEQLSIFIDNWIKLIDSVKKNTEYLNTRNAVVLFDLSLQERDVQLSFSENQDGFQLDPLINAIEEFVTTCHKKSKPPPLSSDTLFTPKNLTEEFLGSLEKREKAVLQYNNMNGLHGGSVIVVTGLGNVMVQLVSPDDEKNKMWEKRYSFDVSPEQLEEIFIEIINNDVLTIQMEDRTGVPDETRIHFSMTNENNDFFKLDTWERMSLSPDEYQNNPRAKFDKACLGLKRLAHIARTEKKPVQEGPYSHP